MFRAAVKKIKDLSIRRKLFITYLGLVTVPILLLLSINLYFSSRDSEQQAKYTMGQVLNQTKSNIEIKTEAVNNIAAVLSLNDTLQELSQKSGEFYKENIGDWMIDEQNLTKELYFTNVNPNITSMHFYMKEGLAAAAPTDMYMVLGDVTQTDWYKRLSSDNFELNWFRGEEIDPKKGAGYISAVKGISGSQGLFDIVGIIRLDVKTSELKTALDQSLFTKSTSAFLINSRGETLTSGSLPTDDLTALAGAAGTGAWDTVRIGQEEYLLGVQAIRFTDWRLVLVVPYRDILAFNINTRNQMILIFLIIAPLTLPLSLLVANSATKRIRKLISNMKKTESGNFNVSVQPGNNDEIGQLARSFNYMLKRMEGLMNDKFKLGIEIKNLEIKALQAQINPHFLYNTLDLINWMAIRNNTPEIGRLAETLGRFYKLSLSRGEETVTITNEIEHVKAYVKIQNMRFDNNIRLEIDMPEEILGCRIVKLVLQPIVENSILHGILEKEDEKGTIRISGEMIDGIITLSVWDDSVGMTAERISEISSGVPASDSHGYGVHNINERVKLIYGNDYCLAYESTPGVETVAKIKIPAVLDKA